MKCRKITVLISFRILNEPEVLCRKKKKTYIKTFDKMHTYNTKESWSYLSPCKSSMSLPGNFAFLHVISLNKLHWRCLQRRKIHTTFPPPNRMPIVYQSSKGLLPLEIIMVYLIWRRFFIFVVTVTVSELPEGYLYLVCHTWGSAVNHVMFLLLKSWGIPNILCAL